MRAHFRRRIFMAVFLALALAAAGFFILREFNSQQDPFAAAAIADPPFPSLTYGIQAFLWWDNGDAGKHLDWVRLLSFSHVKQTFAWRDLEPLPGAWDWTQSDRIYREAARRGLSIIARLGQVPSWAIAPGHSAAHDSPPEDLSLWAEYCSRLAERYQGKIAAYQIWNEPNLSREWGGAPPDPAGYVKLLAACSDAIRAADPAAILISAGLATTGTNDDSARPDDIYLDHMYRNGFQKHIDVVGVHAPGYSEPELSPDSEEALQRFFTFRRVEDLRKIMISHDDAERQMAIMEFGYTTEQINPEYKWFSVTEPQQAELLERAYEYAIANWRPWVGLMTLIYLPDATWRQSNEEYWWSIVEPDTGIPRPAFITVANMRKVCDDFEIPAREPDSAVAEGRAPAPICPN